MSSAAIRADPPGDATETHARLAPALKFQVLGSREQDPEVWPYVRVFLDDRLANLSPRQAYAAAQSVQGLAMRHGDVDFGRLSWPAWATLSIANPSDEPQRLVLSTRQTTLEEFELRVFRRGTWERVLGRHELAQSTFERDRAPSFDLQLEAHETLALLIKTETAAPIKYLLQVQSVSAQRAEQSRQHLWVILAYAVPLVLVFFIAMLRQLEGVGRDWLFIGLVASDLLASSWLVGLAPELFPKISGWTYRWFGQIAYACLLFFVCWHERHFLNLKETVPAGDKVVRITGWAALILIISLLIVDLRLGARLTMPVLLVGTSICMIVSVWAIRRQVPYARTYCLALWVYLISSLAYVLYYLGLAPMTLFGALAFAQTAGICIVMSVAVTGSLVSKDQKLQKALHEADQQRQAVQLLAMERDRLFTAANHDLRQPLQAVALNLELLRQLNLSPEQQAISARMRLALSSMSNMLSSFLDLRRASSQDANLKLVPVALGPILEGLGLEYREHARAKGLSLKTVRTTGWVLSDAALLERAVRNLLSNAMRYTDQGRVLIGVRRRGNKLSIMVTDSGRGISKEQLGQLFREGAKMKSSNEQPKDLRFESYGLGLFIVKAIGERLAASVKVSSKVGQGSTFQIILPRCPASQIPTQVAAPVPIDAASSAGTVPTLATKPLKGKHVLVVDDDEEILIVMSKLLNAWGAEVNLENSTTRAMNRLKGQQSFDAVICDYDLGQVVNGIEILRVAGLAHPQARRLLMSGRPKDEVFCFDESDHVVWLTKPLEAEQLLEALT
jgi:signal transduction histidine kinase/CheY-like chemotaxis protein